MGRTIAIIGGTGALGTGFAGRWAGAGHKVVIGSRTTERAEAAAAAVGDGAGVEGLLNADAARVADIVVLTVPYAHHGSTLDAIAGGLEGKILVDATVPLRPPRVGTVRLPEAGSAAVEAQLRLGDGVRVVSAFQNVAAAHLQSAHAVDCDVLVAGDMVEAREVVVGLAGDLGLRAWHAGPLANSAAAEALTSVIIQINRRYGIDGAGIRITGARTDGLPG